MRETVSFTKDNGYWLTSRLVDQSPVVHIHSLNISIPNNSLLCLHRCRTPHDKWTQSVWDLI